MVNKSDPSINFHNLTPKLKDLGFIDMNQEKFLFYFEVMSTIKPGVALKYDYSVWNKYIEVSLIQMIANRTTGL